MALTLGTLLNRLLKERKEWKNLTAGEKRFLSARLAEKSYMELLKEYIEKDNK